jgi:hypothetical protein
MHKSPAVSADALRCDSLLPFLVLLGCASVTASVFAGKSFDSSFTSLVPLGFSLFVAVLSIYGWWTSPVGRLSWDGQHWTWSGFVADPECNPEVHLDFQWCVLLSFRNQRGLSAWIFLHQKNNLAIWPSLRRALLTGSDDKP